VTVFRGEGADNVTWLWTVNQDRSGTAPVASWWPGAKYVTWVGIDGYYIRRSDTFAKVFGRTIGQVRAITRKPILLSETGVGPGAGRFVRISNLFDGIAQAKALGLVWFDESQQGGPYRQSWRIEGDRLAEVAFRLGTASLNLTRP
jgi:beta-mannanase